MIKRMILNADDFGLTQGITDGTIKCHQAGILTSTTCMMNQPFAEYSLNLAKNYPNLGVGIHLVLTAGRPLVSGDKTLTDSDGNFKKLACYPEGASNVDLAELYTEWQTQIEKFIAIAGKKPTHLDSHHFAHLFSHHHEVAIRLANAYDLPMRQNTQIISNYEFVPCDSTFYGDNLTNKSLEKIISNHEGTIEIMCHPAYVDHELLNISSYAHQRAKELEIICSDQLKQLIKAHQIELINYAQLKKHPANG